MFMAAFGHLKTGGECRLLKQYCCSYYGAPLSVRNSLSVCNVNYH